MPILKILSLSVPALLPLLLLLLVKLLKNTLSLTLREIRQIIIMWCYINYPVPKENCRLALINTSYKGIIIMWCYINYPVPKENCQLALINTSYKGNKGAYDNAKSNARDTILFTIFFTNC